MRKSQLAIYTFCQFEEDKEKISKQKWFEGWERGTDGMLKNIFT